MNENICGCCEGLKKLTPMNTANRPGLSSLDYRVGTYATFLETMKARLSSSEYPGLKGLRVRDPSDPAIAFLDAWATVADVLTFYQERIVNEGFLRTATEPRSILELARLVGYNPRPGVASSVFLAFTLENDFQVEIPVGTRAQSLPGPGEQPQFFETSERLEARAEWNSLKPCMTKPQKITLRDVLRVEKIFIQGTEKNLTTNDLLLFVFRDDKTALRRVQEVNLIFEDNCSEVILQEVPKILTDFAKWIDQTLSSNNDIEGFYKKVLNRLSYGDLIPELNRSYEDFRSYLKSLEHKESTSPEDSQANISKLISELVKLPSIQPPSASSLVLNFQNILSPLSDANISLYTTIYRSNKKDFSTTIANAATTSPPSRLRAVYVFRLRAPLFGQNVQDIPVYDPRTGIIKSQEDWLPWPKADDEGPKKLFLNAQYSQIKPGSYVAIQKPGAETLEIFPDIEVKFGYRFAYGFGGETTEIILHSDWREEDVSSENSGVEAPDTSSGSLAAPVGVLSDVATEGFLDTIIRGTVVYAQSEELKLVEEPKKEPIENDKIELNGFFSGLNPGRRMILSGERVIAGTNGINASELVMLSGVDQPKLGKFEPVENENQAEDDRYTVLQLAKPLEYKYKRETVTIYGNVAKATHGETHSEVLGNGESCQKFQEFSLQTSPLTYLPAPTSSGAENTLEVRANDVLWYEADSLAGLGQRERSYITKKDEDGKTKIIFGDGVRGARLPTGIENVKAKYRKGIGKPGNVKAEQISNLASRPLGVKGVINPLPATGGADRETRDQARCNAPLAVMALDRLVSVQDYTDFVRTFAGIGKARATRLSDGRKDVVHITIAGIDDIPIDTSSELYRNLLLALRKVGDPHLPVKVVSRELLVLVMSAKVRVLPDYQWESVGPKVRAALLEAFSFERRELGQDLLLSDVISTIQKVQGVEYVDVDIIGGIPEKDDKGAILSPEGISRIVGKLSEELSPSPRKTVNLARSGSVRPDQIAYLIPNVPETLILTELKT